MDVPTRKSSEDHQGAAQPRAHKEGGGGALAPPPAPPALAQRPRVRVDDAEVVSTIDDALSAAEAHLASGGGDEIMIAGGAEIYAMALPHATIRLQPEAGEGLLSFLEKREPDWYPG